MTIPFVFSRPKLTTNTTISEDLEVKTPTEVGGKIQVPIAIDTLTQDSIALTGLSWDTGVDLVTGSSGAFTNVRLGDVFEGVGGDGVDFASGAYVIAITDTTLQLSSVALTTQAAVTGTILQKIIDATVTILEITPTSTGQTLTLSYVAHNMDGTRVYETTGSGDYDGAVTTDGTAENIGTTTINLDSFYGNARVTRVNLDTIP